MKKITFTICALIFAFISCQNQSLDPAIQLSVPKNFPKPVYDFSKNPISNAGFELGKALFYDGLLSKDGTISCGSCHQQQAGFTQHGHDLSHGINDLPTLRNALPIQNLAWQKEFFWDGGVFNLDLFAISPIEAHNEMDETLPNVLDKLRNHAKYPAMFEKAFGTKEVTTARFLKALSQFQLMCISANSKYDKYVRNEGVTLTDDELGGLQLFKQKCATCHVGELFSDFSYRNNGLPIGNEEDTGRGRITLNKEDNYKFRVPSLRNIEATRPYMHDGRFRSLEVVLEHYEKGIMQSQTLDNQLKNEIPLSADEKQKIIAFLKTLTDEEFMSNKLLSEF
ncbi:MAG: cytochrome-c peroxidase [Cytophagales bacterium]|nr:MAG: cytochrome-c peroxidase [Cytophagales bacterium]